VAVAGRNAPLELALVERYGIDPRVRIVGFTERMRDLLCAADVFVTATAGLSCHEALLCGCPMICHGFAIAHVRDNIRALQAHGLARVATTTKDLTRELVRALELGRRAIPTLAGLPRAGDLVADLARTHRVRPAPA